MVAPRVLGRMLVLAALVVFPAGGQAACQDPARQALVPGGFFWMGSDERERTLARSLSSTATVDADWFSAELPRRRVRTGAFCIDRLLVTHAGYARFVAATGHRPPGISPEEYRDQGFLLHPWEAVEPYLWSGRLPRAGKADHPVVLVDASDAEAYCRWRNPAGRLPSEVEWEKAARGGDGRIFPWGDGWQPAWLNSAARGPGGTTPAGLYPRGASPAGLLDAVGNVFQWTATSSFEGRRILKGCAWDDDAGLCRPAFRHARPAASRHILIGFRCQEPDRAP